MHVSGVYKSGLYCSLDDNLGRDSRSSGGTNRIGNAERFGLERPSKHAINHKQQVKKENTAIYQSLLTQSGEAESPKSEAFTLKVDKRRPKSKK